MSTATLAARPPAILALRDPRVIAWSAAFAGAFAAIAIHRPGVNAALLVPLLTALAVALVVDLRTKLLPDVVTLPALVYALVLAWVSGRPTVLEAIVGMLVAGGLLLAIAVVSGGAVGGGDVKLMAVLGAALGWKSALAVLAASQVLGVLVAVVLLALRRVRDRKTQLPIGSLIALLGAAALLARV